MKISDLEIKDVVLVEYPYEEDSTQSSKRPAIIISKNEIDLRLLVVKVTKHAPRDTFDYEIVEWVKANLTQPSTVRASKLEDLPLSSIIKKYGTLEDNDYNNIIDLVNEFTNSL